MPMEISVPRVNVMLKVVVFVTLPMVYFAVRVTVWLVVVGLLFVTIPFALTVAYVVLFKLQMGVTVAEEPSLQVAVQV